MTETTIRVLDDGLHEASGAPERPADAPADADRSDPCGGGTGTVADGAGYDLADR